MMRVILMFFMLLIGFQMAVYTFTGVLRWFVEHALLVGVAMFLASVGGGIWSYTKRGDAMHGVTEGLVFVPKMALKLAVWAAGFVFSIFRSVR